VLLQEGSEVPAMANRREQIVAPFRYDSLNRDKAALARRAEEAIKRTLAANVRKIGAELLKVKSCLDHGEWLAWLEFRCELSERSAQRYISVAKFLNEVQVTGPVSDTGLVQLAAPTTPQPVREELVQKINAGTRLTTRAIAKRIAKAKGHQARAQRGKKPEQGRAPGHSSRAFKGKPLGGSGATRGRRFEGNSNGRERPAPG
jgi:Protein of unknown function (DUF3102)